ncbi:MAG: ABC transporter ATP-binding protein [Armatimonadota bacterium]|nr:ABC transporter ATP-binding protein [Armatimonadota bacterium]MDR7426425.1 ABC transporter ATP-binding protein [Armatimonadota bacterium]MDR7464566.1 ABC transporter ATP-binding protein [Armatimonadota bacterium]MDR7473436.1 ABC transporter ATP-binding protein [Armatimonadota bacterium]MDR7540255.1 ABC transporter ATP-binding protein [Armatimonadota bacterium]
MPDDVLLSVRDLHTWFELRRLGFVRVGWVRAVDGVSFDLLRGEAVAVVGESGCGKSTLAKTILGLHPPTRGEIVFDGRRVHGSEDLRWYRSRVGYVQQDPYGALPPFMPAQRILEEPLLINGVTRIEERMRRIRRILEEVKLTPVEDFLHRFPHMLSGGQQQRLVVARAMILEPQLIVADEPVSMLDASVRVEVLHLLRGLQARHDLSIIYITHDLSTVRYFCERVFVMYGGMLIEQAPVEELLRAPKHPYTQALLAAIPDPDPDNAARMRDVPPGEPPSLLKPPAGCRFHPRCAAAIAGVCDVRVPPHFQPAEGHHVACWLYGAERDTVPAATSRT